MNYKTGELYCPDDFDLELLIKWPIWLMTEDENDPDEPMMTPVINTINLIPEMLDNCIFLKIIETNFYAVGRYDFHSKELSAISIWDEEMKIWNIPSNMQNIHMPMVFQAFCQIEGLSDIKFIFSEIDVDRAIIFKLPSLKAYRHVK